MAPRLTLSTARLDLGDGEPNEILRGELKLTNPGATAVKYALIKHCGCTELSPRSGTLGPGEKETIRVGVELPDHANSEKNTLVEVQAGNSATIVASCALVARCPAPFQVAPSYVTFGALANDELSVAREVRLWSAGATSQALLENLQIEHGNDAFVVATAVAESRGDPSAALQGPTGLGTGSAIEIRITLKRGLTRGDHYDVLDLRLSTSGHSMRVPLHAQVTEAVRVVPSTVYLRHDVVNGGFQPMVFLVVGRKSARPLGAVSAVGAPAGTSVEDLGATTNGARRCRLAVGSWPNSTDQPEIALSVEGVRQPLAIKLRRPSRK